MILSVIDLSALKKYLVISIYVIKSSFYAIYLAF